MQTAADRRDITAPVYYTLLQQPSILHTMSSRDRPKPLVPSFSSFKKQEPSAPIASLPDTSADPPRQIGSGTAKTSESERHRSRRDGHRKRSRHADSSRHGRRSLSPTAASAKGDDTTAPLPPQNTLFTIDTRGDPLILRYGSNDRSSVPTYRRAGRGRLLGAHVRSGFLVVDREGAKEVFAMRPPRDPRGSVFSEKHFSLLRCTTLAERRIIPKPHDSASVAETEEYMSISNPVKRKRQQGSPESRGDEHLAPPLQRSFDIENGASESDSGPEDDLDGAAEDLDDNETSTRYIALSRQVKEHPEDVASWLQLIRLQDLRLRFGTQDMDESEATNVSKSVAQVKLDMFESALSHAKSMPDRERLMLGLMREGSQVWSPKSLGRRWEEVSRDFSQSFLLWRAHLDHFMTNVGSFNFDDTKVFFVQRFSYLRAELSVTVNSGLTASDAMELCDQLLYVLLRATRFLQDSGYVERALAVWQAMLELTFCRPAHLTDSPATDCLSAFADFWEGEAARFGEDGSKGWHSAQDMGPDEVPEPKTSTPLSPAASRDVYKAWAATEKQRASKSGLPARTLDEDAVEDPLRVVMFSDMEDLLFVIPNSVLAQGKSRLLEALVHFCRLPPAFESDGLMRLALDDPFIAGKHPRLDEATETAQHEEVSKADNGSEKQPQFHQDESRMATSSDVLFAAGSWFPYLGAAHDFLGTTEVHTWVSNTFKQLTIDRRVEEFSGFYLALQWKREPQSVKKVAKSLLKLYPANLSLYKAYACAEYANGNSDLARKILVSAASQKLALDEAKAQPLWNSLAWMELEGTGIGSAAAVLCSSVEQTTGDPSALQTVEHGPVTPAQLLKARQTLQSMRDYQLSLGKIEGAAIFAESHALLEYVLNQDCAESKSDRQGNISAAMASISAFSTDVCSRGDLGNSSSHERLLQFAAKLVYFHTRHGSYRPAYVREVFSRFVALFPRNTMFLALFAWAAESSPRIDDPVRRLLLQQRSSPDEKTPSTTLDIFAVYHELRVGNAHSARAALERALAGPCRGDAGLWAVYVHLCCTRRELRRRAKDVFYRAVAACPWSKELAMEAFAAGLVRDMASDELRTVFNTLSARGLRMHVDLDEFVDEWRRRRKPG